MLFTFGPPKVNVKHNSIYYINQSHCTNHQNKAPKNARVPASQSVSNYASLFRGVGMPAPFQLSPPCLVVDFCDGRINLHDIYHHHRSRPIWATEPAIQMWKDELVPLWPSSQRIQNWLDDLRADRGLFGCGRPPQTPYKCRCLPLFFYLLLRRRLSCTCILLLQI